MLPDAICLIQSCQMFELLAWHVPGLFITNSIFGHLIWKSLKSLVSEGTMPVSDSFWMFRIFFGRPKTRLIKIRVFPVFGGLVFGSLLYATDKNVVCQLNQIGLLILPPKFSAFCSSLSLFLLLNLIAELSILLCSLEIVIIHQKKGTLFNF